MFPTIILFGHAHICADRIKCVNDFAARPAIINTHNCELIVPTFATRSTVSLANGMEFYTDQSRQEILSAIDKATQLAYDLATQPYAVSDHIMIDPMRIVAVLPYITQLCDYAEEHGYSIQCVAPAPQSLIVMDDGDTCLAVNDTPAELVDKLSKPRQG